jgi:phospholipid/cholesterol/gamma-HCH transport system substrate-binding protein
VKVPANVTAQLGQTSLLGSKHVQLTAPSDTSPVGTLAPGATIQEARTHLYPATEDLLAGVSTLLNGGGLQHFETITGELNTALGGDRAVQARQLLGQLDTFTGGLDKQKDDIVTAMKGFDRLGSSLAPRMQQLDVALQQLPGGLKSLDDNEPALVDATQRLGRATASLAPFSDGGSKELRGILRELQPTLRSVGDAQSGSIPRVLRHLPFVIFPLDIIPYAVRGDYVNIRAIVNLTLDSLDKNLFTGTPASGLLYQIAQHMRAGGTHHDGPAGGSSGLGNGLTGLLPGGHNSNGDSSSGGGPLGLPGLGGN